MRRNRTTVARWGVVAGVFLVPFGWAVPAHAHGVELDQEQTDAVAIEATYDTGEPMVDAQVSVYSPDDSETPWENGHIDEEGNFLFVPTEEGTWEVEVRQAGHGDVIEVSVEQSEPAVTEEEGEDEAQEQDEASPQQNEAAEQEAAGTAATDTSASGGTDVFQIVLMSALAIWGAIGTALYFVSRRRA